MNKYMMQYSYLGLEEYLGKVWEEEYEQFLLYLVRVRRGKKMASVDLCLVKKRSAEEWKWSDLVGRAVPFFREGRGDVIRGHPG
jgi:hypothetical protein